MRPSGGLITIGQQTARGDSCVMCLDDFEPVFDRDDEDVNRRAESKWGRVVATSSRNDGQSAGSVFLTKRFVPVLMISCQVSE